MIGLQNFKTNNKDINFFFVNLSQTKYRREELITSFSTFTKFMDIFHVGVKELCELFDEVGATDRNLFEYTTVKTDFPVCEDGVFTEKWKQSRYGGGRYEKTYYNVYLTINPYVSLYLNKIAKELTINCFPFLMEEPFVKPSKRFNDNINRLPKSLKAEVESIECGILFDNNLTIGDLIKIYTEEGYKDGYVKKPVWNVYADGHLYITVNENMAGHTINTSFNELVNGDWNAIENHHVFSVCLYDENGEQIKGKWYKGLQKNAPYFTHPIVEKLKEMIAK